MCDEFVDNPDYDDSHYIQLEICMPAIDVFWLNQSMVFLPDRPHQLAVSGRFTLATNDPNSAGYKRHDGRTSDRGCARPVHRSRRGSPVGRSERAMSTASAEARAH